MWKKRFVAFKENFSSSFRRENISGMLQTTHSLEFHPAGTGQRASFDNHRRSCSNGTCLSSERAPKSFPPSRRIYPAWWSHRLHLANKRTSFRKDTFRTTSFLAFGETKKFFAIRAVSFHIQFELASPRLSLVCQVLDRASHSRLIQSIQIIVYQIVRAYFDTYDSW